ncbi:MAG: ATP synthase F1 subunit gamma [Bacteroidota bacterium]
MATLRDIRRRISGVKSTQKITKAMKMVAAAKLRRAQESIVSARPYARMMRQMLQDLIETTDVSVNPLLQHREVNNVAVVIVTADRGLCGAFNSNIAKAAIYHIEHTYKDLNAAGAVKLYCIGKRGFDFFSKHGYTIGGKKTMFFNVLDFSNAQEIARELIEGYLKGAFDRIEIVYNEFKSVIQQKIIIEEFLPIPALQLNVQSGRSTEYSYHVDYIYEPSAPAIVNALLPKHLNFEIWRVLLESNAAEQGARMTAMDNATTNASEIISDLQLSYNKARQAAITKELLEIVSGAEALRKAG